MMAIHTGMYWLLNFNLPMAAILSNEPKGTLDVSKYQRILKTAQAERLHWSPWGKRGHCRWVSRK